MDGDPWGWVDTSADDITYIEPGLTEPIIGLKEYKKYLRKFKGKVNYQGSDFIDPEAVILGEAALLTYNYRSTATEPDGRIVNQIPWNATEVYFQRDSEWRIAHTHWSYTMQKLPTRVDIPLPVEIPPKEYDGLLKEIMGHETAAMERWRTGDPWGFIELYAPNATYFDTGSRQRINGWEALKAELAQRSGKIFYDVMDFIAPKVQGCGDMAVLTYRFMDTHLNPDGSISRRTPWNCTEVFVRRAGIWKIIHTHWSFIKGERQ
jgi:ketosteroid isomerase-like protein